MGELDPQIATLQGSTVELLQFTVLGIIDKVMLVLHRTTNETYIMKVRTISIFLRFSKIIVGSLESANSSILAAHSLFKEVVGKKSGFYVN